VSIATIDGEPLESVTPLNPVRVGQWVRALAGPDGGPGEESFDLIVCTPTWLAGEVSRNGPIVGRHHLIVDRWDHEQVRGTLVCLFSREEADDWPELGLRLSRLGSWEFEDYQGR
jgi:hypothetical protein